MPDLRTITDFASLLETLRDDLHWPIEEYGLDELTFEYDADELGLRDEEAEKLKDGIILQLRPLPGGQPFGIFFVEFGSAKLPVVVLRRILNALVIKKRNSANPADRQHWDAADILFISAFGENDDREIAFAHFHKDPGTTELPVLRVLGWDGSDTPLKTRHVAEVLKNRLQWPDDPADHDAWRRQWRGAFRHRPGHIIKTANDLADALAGFARKIRDAATTIMAHESEAKGHLRKLHRAFQSALIHDLTEEDFADTYAQTVTYGLLTAAISRTPPDAAAMARSEQTALTQDDITAMVPVTNPFLKEMLEEFLKVGGRKGGVDFDELGINDVVELLRGDETDLPAILRDFGNRKPGEDPVIHFYENFLKAYNKQLRIKRGVFYTPKPVVSYIVRSVHELLITEFGLEHGLAETITWGEFIQKSKINNPQSAIKLPPLTDEHNCTETISPDEFFVQILDPATGTATFPVEVIDVIHKHLERLWDERGAAAMPHIPLPENCNLNTENFTAWWNCYVPHALLPRLHAYELMMAPYAIAHMKIGLKLAETGYRFDTEERARIYLTNALEPWVKQLPLIGFDALAHEASAVNEIKRHKRFTVVIGNPPYAGVSSNEGQWIENLLRSSGSDGAASYFTFNGAPLDEPNTRWLNDDYVKFLRLAQSEVANSKVGIAGLITNHSWFENPTFRGMRQSTTQTFPQIYLLDLHGNTKKKETTPNGSKDENVFDIQQGVAISLLVSGDVASSLRHADLFGLRSEKYGDLLRSSVGSTCWHLLTPDPTLMLWRRFDATNSDEYESYPVITDIFSLTGGDGRGSSWAKGLATTKDHLFISFDRSEALEKIGLLASTTISDSLAGDALSLADTPYFKIADARRAIRKGDWKARICSVTYRPFDTRVLYWHPELYDVGRGASSKRVMSHLFKPNIALITSRMTKGESFAHAFVTRFPVEVIFLSSKTSNNAFVFPLKHYPDLRSQMGLGFDQAPSRTNLNPILLRRLAQCLGLNVAKDELQATLAPEEIIHYIYAVFHSPGYRSRYAEFLKIDFPRLPLTGSLELFHALASLGGELVALHLLESPLLETPRTRFFEGSVGVSPANGGQESGRDARAPVSKVTYTADHGGTVWIDGGGTKKAPKPGTSGFAPVPENIWNFHIGGYQVCEKWLKDRKGRTLTAEDIAHYHKIIIALTETIRLMAEIDQVIDQHGGWPGAFSTPTS